MSSIKTYQGLRIQKYENAALNSGRIATVWMDQYGRVLECTSTDGTDEWKPTGECGYANH